MSTQEITTTINDTSRNLVESAGNTLTLARDRMRSVIGHTALGGSLQPETKEWYRRPAYIAAIAGPIATAGTVLGIYKKKPELFKQAYQKGHDAWQRFFSDSPVVRTSAEQSRGDEPLTAAVSDTAQTPNAYFEEQPQDVYPDGQNESTLSTRQPVRAASEIS